jgi:hypothetical protein
MRSRPARRSLSAFLAVLGSLAVTGCGAADVSSQFVQAPKLDPKEESKSGDAGLAASVADRGPPAAPLIAPAPVPPSTHACPPGTVPGDGQCVFPTSAAAGTPGPASPGQMGVPGPLALPCQDDTSCGTHRCNVQYGKCAFPCQSAADCLTPAACVAGLCLPPPTASP